jgi:glycosyltransferase involved in cell wall biosynthesis
MAFNDADMQPLVSVVVPTLNRADLLVKTLESILDQDYPHLEVIVIDAGGTEETRSLLKSYGERISWRSRPDRGAFDAINDGWKMAKGDILSWLNDDDTWVTPGAVTTVVRYMTQHPDVDVAYGDCGGIDIDDRMTWYGAAEPWDLSKAILECHPILNQPASFMRREIIERAGYLYPAWCHDHDLWLRIAVAGGRFGIVPAHLGNARLWTNNLHMDAGVVVPAKIALTQRILANPKLPEDLRRQHGRILSNAYLRCLDFLPKPRQWGWVPFVLLKSFLASPRNAPRIVEQVVVHAAWLVPGLRRSLQKKYGHGVQIERGSPLPATARGMS